MFENYSFAFKIVYELARKKHETYSQSNDATHINNGSFVDEIVVGHYQYNKYLTTFLLSLDEEVVHTLKIIMYLGRDKEFDESKSAEYIFSELKKYLDFDTKEIEVHQLTNKIPLDEYLEQGFQFLNVKI